MSHRGSSDDSTVVATVDALIAAYYPLPVLIHTQNYRLTKLIKQRSRFGAKILTHDTESREQVFEEYRNGSGFRCIASPSMGLGVDFPFIQALNIIVKYPFPNTADRQVAARRRQSKDWYNWATTAAVCQIYGRGSRAPSHLSDTVCIDDNHDWFYRANHRLFPKFATEAIQSVPLVDKDGRTWQDFFIERGKYIRGVRNDT